MCERCERLEEALQKIVRWSEAYPPMVFPEPDWVKAAGLLKAGGITIDAVSAALLRRALEGAGKIARKALQPMEGEGAGPRS
jgi:hypothetical protein